ncbi:DUF2971 domain-containing protein [Aliiglaciecola lipolytica]|uniref:DUF2971 domain-containing protein n=1 Tax=Aliiglaciecola lipolytica TaxID=477689 RepID=UPI001C0A10CA|nr:DUF2971 domain-containing protein [Aliiglaciecola lipolytica]
MKGSLYKFMAGESYHLDALAYNQVYFSKFRELNDPYEGLLHFNEEDVTDELRMALLANGLAEQFSLSLSQGRKKAERLVKKQGEGAMRSLVTRWTRAFFDGYLKYHLEERYVLSLSLQAEVNEFPSPLNNMMMWSHYANGMRGLCVEYDYDLLLRSIERLNNEIQVSTSKYKESSLLKRETSSC